MDIYKYKLDELILVAIKSEIESEEVYSYIVKRVKNAILKDRMKWLAREEIKHKVFLESLYQNKFGKETIILPEKTIVPIPHITIESENQPISSILEQTMDAELFSKEFYAALIDRFEDKEVKKMLKLLSNMESEHYAILKSEVENAKIFEDYETIWPMTHLGP